MQSSGSFFSLVSSCQCFHPVDEREKQVLLQCVSCVALQKFQDVRSQEVKKRLGGAPTDLRTMALNALALE